MRYTDPISRHPGYVNTGRIRIGIAYVPKARRLNSDEEQIQAGLLASQKTWRTQRGHSDGMVAYLTVLAVFVVTLFTFI